MLRVQFTLRTLLAAMMLACIGIAGLRSSWLWISDGTGSLSGFLSQFCGGLALAGGAFGGLIGMPFRRPILFGAMLGLVLPVFATAALIFYVVNYGPRC